ncbi:ribonuclease HI family protein [Staphylococcus simiae]|uniref:ribonuclease HI family protein n=1 Tax=Staphylococcus simiae TaxID=308354 RepID=UPI001A97514D|nr:ribonuclease HI family protein [Staphylococcus simiae]MBO1197845.1 ribonuclease HI family protein [Staphylococcus simiae]MBO1200494.1 ribonuclease HI family protein [Staphylococcus simiae]MBO1202766.1 ribonuclease HI family protein [Staphylococcus simiae]MBO1211479.1 ribonuclease HI family protein [Staphylococcus simiae]MBO1230234.1 ribonuclease HI family protein [Staphylococcus simiae]
MAQIYFDAATSGNPGHSACGIIINENGEKYVYTHDLGVMDNHSAEWATFIRALEHARSLNVTTALLYTDSKVIADSVDKGFTKNSKFKPYFDQMSILEQSFDLMFVKWIPRDQNKEANHHAKQALYKMTKK